MSTEGEWAVGATQGSKALAKPSPDPVSASRSNQVRWWWLSVTD